MPDTCPVEQTHPRFSPSLFHAVVLDVLGQRREDAARSQRNLAASVDALRDRRAWFIELRYRSQLGEEAIQDAMSRLEQYLEFARIELREAEEDEVDAEAAAGFAESVVNDRASLSRKKSVRQKRRLQAMIFPQGVT